MKITKKVLSFFLQITFPIIYALVFFLMREREFAGSLPWNSLLMLAGIYVGELLIFIDEKWLYGYYHLKEDEDFGVIRPATRSLLFVLALIPMGLFMLTATASILGIGVLLGCLFALFTEVFNLQGQSEIINQKYFFQLKRKVTSQDRQILLWGLGAFFLFLGLSSLIK